MIKYRVFYGGWTGERLVGDNLSKKQADEISYLYSSGDMYMTTRIERYEHFDKVINGLNKKVIDCIYNMLNRNSDHLDNIEVTLDTDLINDIGLDSLDSVELIMDLEKEFDIAIPDDDADSIMSNCKVSDIIEYLKEKHDIVDIRQERNDKIISIEAKQN